RDDERRPVACAEAARGPLRIRVTRERRELAVGDRLAERHAPQRLRDRALERRAPLEVERHVLERVAPAREVAGHPLRQGMAGRRRLPPWPGELVQEEEAFFEPELPHAPAVRVVAHVLDRHASKLLPMATHGISRLPTPANEPVLAYAPGSPERAEV